MSAATCSNPAAAPAAPWQLVTGEGFTFCVPANWHSSDGRTWRAGGAFIGWCTRDHFAQCPNVSGELPLIVISNPQQATAAAIAHEGGVCSYDRFDDTVSGALATLSDQQCHGRHVTEAIWRVRGLYFFGQTDDAVTARLQLQVYRTLRFTTGIEH